MVRAAESDGEFRRFLEASDESEADPPPAAADGLLDSSSADELRGAGAAEGGAAIRAAQPSLPSRAPSSAGGSSLGGTIAPSGGGGSPPLPPGVKRPGGVLSTFRSKRDFGRALSDLGNAKDLERLQHDYATKLAAAETARVVLDNQERELRELQRDAVRGTLEEPSRISLQENEVSKAWRRLAEAERTRDAAELSLHHFSDEGQRAAGAVHNETAGAAAVARARHVGEVERARRIISREHTKRAASEDAAMARSEEAERRKSEARKHKSRSVQRLKETHSLHKARQEEADQVREAHFQHDAQRLLTLKSSVDGINKQIQTTNERRKKKEQKVKEDHEKRRKELLADGQNPYEVWRHEEIDADKERQREKLKAATELRNERLLEQLMEEERRYKEKRKEEKHKVVEAEEFQKEVSNYAKEKKIASYIRKMTVENVEVLDPTGTAVRIDPSRVSVHKTASFGLGRARPAEIERVDTDHKSATARLASTRRASTPDLMVDGPVGVQEDSMPSSSAPAKKLPVVTGQYLPKDEAASSGIQCHGGKEWKGDAFLVKPSVIAFNDFEVGRRYKQVIEVTNVSLTLKFNQFKLLPLDDKVKDFFDIHFEPPGRMSPGVTARITIWFNPKVNQSFESTFPFLAMTGRIDVPLVCTIKKTVLTLTPQDDSSMPLLDFGQVLLGESQHRTLSVKNSGALPAKYSLQPADESGDPLPEVSWEPETGEFAAHSATKIGFVFKPTAVGSFEMAFTLAHGPLGGAEFPEEQKVLVKGECLDVPIHVEEDTYDLKTCIFGHIFRESVVVRNRQSVAMKIQVERPKQLPDELQLNPALAYIQGHGEQAIQVKFSPKEDFLDKNPQYRDTSRDLSGAFRIPIRIVGADQLLPVNADLIGVLTTDRISFSPSSLSFGKCPVGASLATRMTVVNESRLPQKFAFARLPGHISVLDVPVDVLDEEGQGERASAVAVMDGGGSGVLGTLLPQEQRSICIAYAPDAATEMDCKLAFKAICGGLCAREFAIECKGQGVAPVLSLSHSQLDLASIPCEASSKESVVVTNVSKAAYTMNLLLPPTEVSGLSASPVCCTLQPGESRRLQLTFKPARDYVDLFKPPPPPPEEPPAEGAAASSAPDEASAEEAAAAAAAEAKQREKEAEEHRKERLAAIRENGGRRWENGKDGTIHATWKLPICMRPQASQSAAGNARTESTIYLSVGTCVLRDVITVSPRTLDFGEVPAQQRRLMPILLSTVDAEEQDLRIDPLPENQGFTVLSAPRKFGSGKQLQLMVEFRPQLVQIYQTVLQLRTQGTRVQVPLVGKGVRPVLKIEPEDGVVHLGAVVYSKDRKDYTTAQLLVKNASPFELSYNLETLIAADPNPAGAPPFTLTPSTGTVEANGQKVVTVTFRPHRPLGLFREKVFVNVPNQKEPTHVYLYGHCFEYQAYALPGLVFGPFGRVDAEPGGAFLDALAVGCGSGVGPNGEVKHRKAQQREFHLQFEQGEKLKPLHLLLGACVPPGTPSAPQNAPAASFKFEIVPSEFSNLFSIEAPEGGKVDVKGEGPLAPGSAKKQVADARPEKQVKVIFRYNPPKETNLTYGGVSLDLLGGIGQWITCRVQGSLNGGYVPPTEPPGSNQEISVTLKAYLRQI